MKKYPLVLLIAFPLVFLLFVRYGYQFNGLYGQDGHAYLRYTKELQIWFFANTTLSYFIWPIIYPLIGAFLSLVFGNEMLILQLISALSLSGVCYYTYKLHEVKKNKQRLIPYFFLFLCLSPIMLKSSIVIMSDMLCLFFIMGAWFYSFDYKKTSALKSVLIASIFSAFAVTTRHVAPLLLIVPMVVVLQVMFKNRLWVHLIIGGLMVVSIIAPQLWIKSDELTKAFNHDLFQEISIRNLFKREFTTAAGTNRYLLPNILGVLYPFVHLLFYLPGVIVLYFFQPKKDISKRKYLWIGLGIYLLFLAIVPYQNKRFLMLTMPFVAMILAPSFTRFYKVIKKRYQVQTLFTVVVIFIQLGVFTYTFNNVYQRNILEQKTAQVINSYPNKTLYGFDLDISLPSYGCNKEIKNLWKDVYPKFRKGSLLLFNVEKNRVQWKDKNPMINWQNLITNYNIIKLNDLGNGYILYEIQ